MIKKIEAFFFGQVFGRVISRLALSGAAAIAGFAAANGVDVDPGQLAAALISGANAAYSAIKAWRDKRASKAVEPAPEAPKA